MNAFARIQESAESSKWRTFAAKLFDELRERTRVGNGITRECYAEGEQVALDLFRETAETHGLKCAYDDAANLVVTMVRDDLMRPAIVLGSHADSVPNGGNFDGAAGIIAGLICLIRLQAAGISGKMPVRLLILRGEESAFYGRANIGSRALLGLLHPNDLKAKQQSTGRTLRSALEGVGANIGAIEAGTRLLPANFAAAYLELHIEQGPIMIARDLPTAVVTGIRGNLRHRRVVCRGESGHSGVVPRWLRRDALFAVSDLLMRLDEIWRHLLERGADLVVTVGICGTDDGKQAISRIPGEVYFSFEARSRCVETLNRFYELFRSECRAVAVERRVWFEFDDRIYAEPATMDESIIRRLRQCSERLGLPAELLASGAGHDAAVFATAGVPSGMIFVRNSNGSHNPDEAMSIDDFLCGVELMHGFLLTELE